jgi:hypothetical protein
MEKVFANFKQNFLEFNTALTMKEKQWHIMLHHN